MPATRSSLSITFSVWKALFLREALTRLSAGRAAWLWLLVEPVAQVIVLMVLFGFILHQIISGIDAAIFIMTGRLGFSLISNTVLQSTNAVNANAALFAYRQVKPVDTVLVRAMLEGFLLLICSIVLLLGAGFVGFPVAPSNLLLVLTAFSLLWLLGLGLGLIFSVASELIPEIGKLVRLAFVPLYFLSAVMHPAIVVPQPHRGWLMLNPIAQGIEILHAGYFEQFHAAPETSIAYLSTWVLASLLLGLMLHVRFSVKLSAQ